MRIQAVFILKEPNFLHGREQLLLFSGPYPEKAHAETID